MSQSHINRIKYILHEVMVVNYTQLRLWCRVLHACFHFSQIWSQAPPRPTNPGPVQAARPRRWGGAIFSARVHRDSPVGRSYHSGKVSQPRHVHPGNPQKHVPVSEAYGSVEIITKASRLWVIPITSASCQIYLQLFHSEAFIAMPLSLLLQLWCSLVCLIML